MLCRSFGAALLHPIETVRRLPASWSTRSKDRLAWYRCNGNMSDCVHPSTVSHETCRWRARNAPDGCDEGHKRSLLRAGADNAKASSKEGCGRHVTERTVTTKRLLTIRRRKQRSFAARPPCRASLPRSMASARGCTVAFARTCRIRKTEAWGSLTSHECCSDDSVLKVDRSKECEILWGPC